MIARSAIFVFMSVLAAVAAEVTLAWDASPPEEEVSSYKVYQATNVVGPYEVVLITPTNFARITLPAPGRYFWYVTAVNFWESEPSNIVNSPAKASAITTLRISR
jgi:hypothetical protein